MACGKNKECQLNKKRACQKCLENMGNNTIPDLADRVVAAGVVSYRIFQSRSFSCSLWILLDTVRLAIFLGLSCLVCYILSLLLSP